MWPPTPADASPRLGGGGPGAFFLPNTRFICLCERVLLEIKASYEGAQVEECKIRSRREKEDVHV